MGKLVKDINFTEQQRKLLHEIHFTARQMEHINNTGDAHYVIAMIEELSEGCIDTVYMMEKLHGLCPEDFTE